MDLLDIVFSEEGTPVNKNPRWLTPILMKVKKCHFVVSIRDRNVRKVSKPIFFMSRKLKGLIFATTDAQSGVPSEMKID